MFKYQIEVAILDSFCSSTLWRFGQYYGEVSLFFAELDNVQFSLFSNFIVRFLKWQKLLQVQ